MLFVGGQLVADSKILFDGVADRIQTAISVGVYDGFFIAIQNGGFCHNTIYLFEMTFADLEVWCRVNVVIFKDLINPLR